MAGVVTAGNFVFRRERREDHQDRRQFLRAGVTIERLDNASNTEPAEFVAFYLSDSKDRPVIELLGAK